jgi:hypothetical protein
MRIIAGVTCIVIEDSLGKFACGPFTNTEFNLPTKSKLQDEIKYSLTHTTLKMRAKVESGIGSK